MDKRGLVQIYCGDGKGKTTASIGLMARAIGYGTKVIFSQFMKNDDSSEIAVIKTLPNVHIYHSRERFGFYFQMTEEEKLKARDAYLSLWCQVSEKAIEMTKDGTFILLIMDELISAYNLGLVNQELVCDFIKNKPLSLEIVITGREPKKELIELADYVSEVRKIKHPFDKGIESRRGIEW